MCMVLEVAGKIMKEIILRKTCPLCGGVHSQSLLKRYFDDMSTIVPFSSYVVTKCDDCGMVYAGDIVEVMPLNEYYDNLSKYETSAYFLSAGTKEKNEKSISFVKDYINEDDDILEIGCGTGNLLYRLQNHGYKKLTGIDPSEKNVGGIIDRWNIRCYVGAIGNTISEIKDSKYRLVILECVLEHMLDLGGAISQLKGYMEKNGYLYLKLPDITNWGKIIDLYQQFSVEHVNYFSLQSLNNILGTYGFRCIKYEIGEFGCSYSLWQYNGLKRCITFANDGDAALDMYLKKSNSLAEDIKNKLSSYREKRVYLWGAGTHTAMLYQLGLLDGIKVQVIIDSNKNYHGKTIFGLNVISPSELLNMEMLPIIISSQLAQESIKEQIAEMCDNEVVELY